MNSMFTLSIDHPANPFSGDKLNMEKSVRNLVDNFIIDDKITNAVIGLNSSYGTGKSTFIDMCRFYIEGEYPTLNLMSVYINISEQEFKNNPLNSILSAIAQETGRKKPKQYRKILLGISRAIVKVSTAGVIDISSLTDDKAIEKNSDKEEAALAGKLYDMFIGEEEDPRIGVIKYLEQLTQETKVIVFLDDIDRCSPSFAIKILEELKFYFKSIKRMIFVIAYDGDQLESFVQTRFGEKIDSSGYLKKFFDYNFLLPQVDKKDFLLNVADICSKALELSDGTQNDLKDIIHKISMDFKDILKHQSLRSLEQCINRVALGLRKHDKIAMTHELVEVLILMLFIRTTNWSLYSDLYQKRKKGIEVYSEIKSIPMFNHTIAYDSILFLLSCDEHGENRCDFESCKEKILENYDDDESVDLIERLEKIIESEMNPNFMINLCFQILEFD